MHFRIAQELLEAAQRKAAANGLPLDVGEFPSVGAGTGASEDPERLAKVTAHMVARVGDRFSFLRKFSRNAEGTSERKAGIISDVMTALITLYERNPDTIKMLAGSLVNDVQQQRAAAKAEREAQKAQAATQTNGGLKVA